MKLDDVKKIAAELGIKAGKLRKADLIQQIQQAEGNDPCYATGKADVCGQDQCLWREDCN
ncbi:MAG: Rho termination factor N-terminal domain-containing protein [Trichlorobacter sp.]|uniref:Rho termination factor N-terminal domain-containing protein n=1 Tax=Trichlorobacter sp. TaxID=2911007 RepID=UPI00255D311D|nr:Rho termination factor N-terminal domain-containing protein [Trichlorobacter sp.]MDK9718866.1 Rho termination factor N-terminal domain-containing protein [Trichlorobacter sp.]